MSWITDVNSQEPTYKVGKPTVALALHRTLELSAWLS